MPETAIDLRFEFRILGPIELLVDGVTTRIGGPRQRALLAFLLLSANRVVSRDTLIHELLEDQAQDAAEHTLRVQVSRLRKALRDEHRLRTQAPGYALEVRPGELDLHRFEQLADQGHSALAADEPHRAAENLRAAEALWRGRPLADLEFESFARVEVERLEELRLAALEDRIEAELQLGRHAALIGELESLVANHPLRERLREQQMLALYRSGRQADALQAYQSVRRLLVGELALEPGPRLRELEQAILRHDGSLAVMEEPRSEEPPSARYRTTSSRPVRWPGRRSFALAGAALALAAAAAIGVAGYRDQTPRRPVSLSLADALTQVGARGGIQRTLPLANAPTEAVAGFGSIWVSEVNADRVVRVNTRQRVVVQTIRVGRGPGPIAVGAGDVWVVNAVDGTVSRIDPGTDGVVQTIRVGSDPSGIAVSRGRVWVTTRGDASLVSLDAVTGRVQGKLAVGEAPSGVAAADGSIWVADDLAGTVARLDPKNGARIDLIHVGDAPTTLAPAGTALWVIDRLDSTISRIDTATDSIVSTTPLPGDPGAVVPAPGGVWVADGSLGRVIRLDARTGAPATTIDLHGQTRALASTPGGLWVALAGAGTAHRGGTLRIASTIPAIDTLDPAASNSPNLGNVFNLTNDGLVALDHAAGADGTRLVPDLAVSLPGPSEGGLAYTFRLRKGIRYSTGGSVRPSDVRRSFERIFELGSAGAAYFSAIEGASTCSKSRCNLAAGIATDNQAGTVTFHLARPDPDFLYKLTLPFADVLPSSTSTHATSVASTGPYEVGRYIAGHHLALVRNPHFRQWSEAAQPAGYPDRITVKLGVTTSSAAAAVAAGRADFVSSLGVLPTAERTYFLIRHPDRVQINPTLGTNFLFLNVNAPPFNDVRVRRALNYALDRAQIVAADGGRSAAEPACQTLPPQLPGYKPYCPYTVGPRRGGIWRGPDLSRARRLVAASGTKGMRVGVWDTFGPPVFLHEGQVTVTALRELGYRASLRLLSDNAYYAYTNNSRNRAQVIDGGWSVNYPAANDLIGKLTCRYYTPGNGALTTDAGELCNRSFDRQVARAARLQTVDAQAADRLWARLDRLLTDRAVWLPTVTPNEVDLLSARVANYEYNPVLGALIDQLWVR